MSWDDDFSKPGALAQWQFLTSGDGDGSLQELQYYDRSNADINSQGQLVFTANRQGGNTCWYGPCQYTSSRMSTYGLFSQEYGRFEAKIKLPPGQGLWPAFWMEGVNVNQVGNPACGEIDIIETNNKNLNVVSGYAHAPNLFQTSVMTVSDPISDGFHVYGVDWTPQGITWTYDGYAYAHINAYPGWPFDQPFFLILNLAVGGWWPGAPTQSTPFPAQMIVDWIHVYKQVG